ncbi:MAG: DNA methyltransferase [Candidatus Poribacteria bacterium]|nr:DNA methyltransferase [Candidatus Poribacteria bacterium]
MNIKSKTIFTGDNLPIMRGINSESVDLIYLDPPFNSNANYAAPIGSEAAGAEFKDTWTLSDVDNAWLDLIEMKYPALNRVIHAAMTNSDKSYLIYMAVRFLEMHRILKDTGSIYLHCDPTMSHYLKLVMDTIFGKQHFQNEIIWCYERGSRRKSQFGRKHDVIFFYSKTKNYVFDSDAVRIERRKTHMKVETDLEGRTWQVKKDAKSGKVYRYPTDVGVLCPDWWIGIQQLNRNEKERLGYPTQKPLALLDRIIKASSNEGNVVFDPFCGCATTLVAADRLQREWIGIDISAKAAELVVERIRDDQGLFEDIIARDDIPNRTDLGNIPRYNAPENKTLLYGEQSGICNGCGTHFQRQHLEVDHIIAENVGGTDHIENLQLLCSHCNRIKGDRGQEYLISRLNKD